MRFPALALAALSACGPSPEYVETPHVIRVTGTPPAPTESVVPEEPPPKALVLPGACIPLVDGNPGSKSGLDLDADGIEDRIVYGPMSRLPGSEPSIELFVMRGECGHLVGTIGGHVKQHPSERRNGLAKLIFGTEIWSFNGERYEKEGADPPGQGAHGP